MSRKITRNAVSALYGGKDFRRDNTDVVHGIDPCYPNYGEPHLDPHLAYISRMYLHGNEIARVVVAFEFGKWNTKLYIRTAGWTTSTTKERLNGLPGVSIYQKDFQWYLNGRPWEDHHKWTAL
tara:strand:- start:560 stop:928 length:369 start_codon:yes stop_codon:yes gene_type:complete